MFQTVWSDSGHGRDFEVRIQLGFTLGFTQWSQGSSEMVDAGYLLHGSAEPNTREVLEGGEPRAAADPCSRARSTCQLPG